MTQLFLFVTYLFMFWIGYKHGRRVEKWENNHGEKKRGSTNTH
jgi:hypothetical protein